MADSEKMIYNLVYDYYETRILMGASRYGEYLPSIPRIGESFQMAPRASYGTAAALATILTVTTVVSLLIFFKVSGNKDVTM